MSRQARCTRAAFVAMLLAWGTHAYALNAALDITQYAHTAWTIGNGAFNGRVVAIAQTPDGYLWLGTDSGLLRFDGMRTVAWQPRTREHLPSTRITRLLVTRDERLWIGTDAGLASWKDGTLVTYPDVAGQIVGSIIEDQDGTVWVGTSSIPSGRLCSIGAAVRCVGQDGRFGTGVLSLWEERRTLWIGATSGLWRWNSTDATRYVTPGTSRSLTGVIRLDSARLLVIIGGDLYQFDGRRFAPYTIPGVDGPIHAYRFLIDRDGALWIATSGRGLIHVRDGQVDLFTRADGLSSGVVQAVFEDREGNVWTATDEGLDRFRELAVTMASIRRGLSIDQTASVLAAHDGSIWTATGEGVNRRTVRGTTALGTRDGLPDRRAGTLFEDSDGRILVATLGGLATFREGRFEPMRAVATRVVYNIVEERNGSLWLNDQEQGLLHVVDEKVVERISWPALGHSDPSTALAIDRVRGGVWIGFYNGGVAFFKDGGIRAAYGAPDGLGGGRVSQLTVDSDGTLWAATAGGLSRIDNHRIVTLNTRNGLPCDSVHWMIADDDHTVWLLTSCGLTRISATEFTAWRHAPEHQIACTLFDTTEGIRTGPTPIGYTPAATMGVDGRLLFATVAGLATIDPRRLPADAFPPTVHVEQLVADRAVYDTVLDARESVRLRPHVHDVQIDYTAPSLRAPEKLRFSYKLEGIDRDWRDVGNRRQAFYTDLAPGRYRFRVAAVTSSGVRSREDAVVDFLVAPAYYQTAWFLMLSVGLVVTLAWTAHRVRLRIVENHQHEITALNERLMKAQEQERIRIAGELHDGVMQQMLGVTMMLGSAKRKLAGHPDAQASLDKIQQKLIQAGTEIRQLSHGLHPPLLHESGLPEALRSQCAQFSAASGIQVVCQADEQARELSRGAALALFRIAQEALANAAKHAAPKHITVRLARSDTVVVLTVSDDGTGFDRSRLATSGGLGLVMMRERAGQLNGTFEFDTTSGRGTTITVTIPFR